MNYGTPARDMGYALAFRSTTANIIIPNPITMDATQRRVTVELLEEKFPCDADAPKTRERGCGGIAVDFR
jgi:hypothetical protein